MAFIECDSGAIDSFDLMAPDAEGAVNAATTSTYYELSVTQKPRYIIIVVISRSSSYTGFIGVIDRSGSSTIAKRRGYLNSGAVSWETWTNWSDYIQVTNTKVYYDGESYGGNHRMHMLVYY